MKKFFPQDWNFCRHFAFCAVIFSGIFLCSSCVPKKRLSEEPAPSATSSEGFATEPLLDSELAKLSRVLSSLSDRAKQAIPNGDPKDFLSDLNLVLESRKNFSSEDLDPFYLIDKRHPVSENYIPKNLIPLTKNEFFEINKNSQ